MRPPAPDPRRLQLDRYPCQHRSETQWAAMDAFGHLNNVAIAAVYEEARARLSAELFGVDVMRGGSPVSIAVASVIIQYLGSVVWPATLTVGIGVLDVGRSSWRCGYGLFDGDQCVGLSEAALVRLDEGRPGAIPAAERARLEALGFEAPRSGISTSAIHDSPGPDPR